MASPLSRMEQQKAAARIRRLCRAGCWAWPNCYSVSYDVCQPGSASLQVPPSIQKPSVVQGLTLACAWVDKAAFHGSSRGSVTCSFHLEIYRAFDFNGFCGISVLPHPSWLISLRQAGVNPSLAGPKGKHRWVGRRGEARGSLGGTAVGGPQGPL